MHQPQHHEEHEAEQGHSLLGQVQQRHPPARWPGPARSGRRGQRCRGRRTRGRRVGGAGREWKVGEEGPAGRRACGRKGRAGPARPRPLDARSAPRAPQRARARGAAGAALIALRAPGGRCRALGLPWS